MALRNTLFVALCVPLGAFAQNNPEIEWQRCYGGTAFDNSRSLQQTTDGGYIMAGNTTGGVPGFHGGARDILVVKLDAGGALEWQKALGGSATDDHGLIQQTNDGGFVLAGSTSSTDGDVVGNHGQFDHWVVKLDPFGVIQWQRALGGSASDGAYSVAETSDGGFLLAGETRSTDGDVLGNHGSADAWVVKLNADGEVQWQQCYGGSSTEAIFDLDIDADAGILITGYTASTDGDVTTMQGLQDFWVLKLDGNGMLQWQTSLGGSGYELATSLCVANDGGYYVTGWTDSEDGDVTGHHGDVDVWVVKLDATGSLVWQRALGGSNADGAYTVNPMDDGGCLVAGYTSSVDGDVGGVNGNSDAWLMRLSPSGVLVWQQLFGGSGGEGFRDIHRTMDGGSALAGTTSSNDGGVSGNHGESDFWLVKLSNEITGLEELGGAYSLALYPNPATGSTTLDINLEKQTYLEFRWYDGAGKFLCNDQALALPAGSHRIPFDTHSLAPGAYQLRVTIDGRSAVHVVVKN